METKNFLKINKSDILTIMAIVGLVGGVFTDIWAKLSAPMSFIGTDNLRSFRTYLLLNALSDVFKIMLVWGLLLHFALMFLRLYRDNRAVKQKLSALQQELPDIAEALPVRTSRGWFIMIPCVLFSAIALGFTGICIFSRGGIAACLREAVCVTSDLSAGKTEDISDIESISIDTYSADKGTLSFGEGGTMYCTDADGNEYIFPVSETEAAYFSGELGKYRNFGFRATFYSKSRVIADYEFCGAKRPDFVETQADSDRTFGRVPISIEVGEDYVYACRPPEMSMNTAWVVMRDGELVRRSSAHTEEYTIFAQYYEKLDIDADIMEPGSYEVYFVRYDGDNVFRLSDSYEFEVEEYMGKPVNIRLTEVPANG